MNLQKLKIEQQLEPKVLQKHRKGFWPQTPKFSKITWTYGPKTSIWGNLKENGAFI